MGGFELVIKVDNAGQLTVGGPIDNKVMCLGILELAKKSIIEYNPTAIQIVRSS